MAEGPAIPPPPAPPPSMRARESSPTTALASTKQRFGSGCKNLSHERMSGDISSIILVGARSKIALDAAASSIIIYPMKELLKKQSAEKSFKHGRSIQNKPKSSNVKLPELLAYVNMEEEALLAKLQQKLLDFSKFLQKKSEAHSSFLRTMEDPKACMKMKIDWCVRAVC